MKMTAFNAIKAALGLLILFTMATSVLNFFQIYQTQNEHNFSVKSSSDENMNLEPNYENVGSITGTRTFLKRAKRFIIFNGGGVVKLVFGLSFPVKLIDRVRSLSCINNLQILYTPPPVPLYWWSFYNTSTFPGTLRNTLQRNSRDLSRDFIYKAIEATLEGAGLPGVSCILQMICEISRTPFHVTGYRNLFHDILNEIFTPKFSNMDEKYFNAYQEGHHGSACNYECPRKMNWLQRSTIFLK